MRTVGISNRACDRFAAFVDLDVDCGLGAVKAAVRASLGHFSVPWAWILRTGRGYHVVAPFCFTFKEALHFHRSLNAVGADDDHRRISISYGRFILRVSAKADSSPPHLVAIVASPDNAYATKRPLLVPIAEFYEHQLGCPVPATINPKKGRGGTVTLESYEAAAKAVPA